MTDKRQCLFFIKSIFNLLLYLCLSGEVGACQHKYILPPISTPLSKNDHFRSSIITYFNEHCISAEHLRTLEVNGTAFTHFLARNGAIAKAVGLSKNTQRSFNAFVASNSSQNKTIKITHLQNSISKTEVWRPKQQFQLAAFDLDYIESVEDNAFDVVFFSNIDALFEQEMSLDELQKIMEGILSKTKIFFIEIPKGGDLEIFERCGSRISLKKISTYKGHSLYAGVVTKKIIVDGKDVVFDDVMELRSHVLRVVYKNNDYILKEQHFNMGKYQRPWFETDTINEINIMADMEGKDLGKVSPLAFSSISPSVIQISFPYIKNTFSLNRDPARLKKEDYYKIIHSFVKTLVQFEKNGLTHHDMSTRNLLYNPHTEEVTVIDFARAANNHIGRQLSMYGWVDKWAPSPEKSRTLTPSVSHILLGEFLIICWELYNKKFLSFNEHTLKSEPVQNVEEYGVFKNIAYLILNKKIKTCQELLEYVEVHPF